MRIPIPSDASHGNALPDRPIFVGDPRSWQANILSCGQPPASHASSRARAVSVAVFRAAAVWSQMFWSPLEYQILAWAELFDSADMEWLTLDLAERAVNEHFRRSVTGFMLPAHVIQSAAVLLLEEGAQHGA